MQVTDCQLLVDLSTRNAVWGAAMHLFHAFRPLPSPTAPGKATAAAEMHGRGAVKGSPSSRDISRRSKSSRMLKPQKSFGHQGWLRLHFMAVLSLDLGLCRMYAHEGNLGLKATGNASYVMLVSQDCD